MGNIYPALGALIGGGTGALDKIDGAILVNGDAAVVILDTGVYHYHLNATSGATENSPYVIAPDTNPGTKRWILVTPTGAFSHVIAVSDSGQSIADASITTVVYGTEKKDSLGEYNHTTGIFTAIHAGLYAINAQAQFNSLSWAAGDELGLSIFVGAVETLTLVVRIGYTGTYRIGPPPISTTLDLNASDAVTLRIKQNSTGSRALQPSVHFNRMAIDRIA